MLEIKIDRKRGADVSAAGSIGEILIDLAIAVNTIFTNIRSSDPEEAESLKKMMQFKIMDDNGLFWKDFGINTSGTVTKIELPKQ